MAMQMTRERMEAYVEVIEILKHMDEKCVKKIPKKLNEFFERNCAKDYTFTLDINKPLIEQNLKTKTITILGMLNLNYWCESEEEKKKLIEKYYEKEKIYQEELRKRYNPDTIFRKQNEQKDKIDDNTIENEVSLVEYKESIFMKIINKIKKIFHSTKRI